MKAFLPPMLLAVLTVLPAYAADSAMESLSVSAGGGVGWDSNLFGYADPVPAGNPPLDNRSSLYLQGQAGVASDLSKLLHAGEQVKKLDLAYVGQYTWYDSASTEDNATQRVNFAARMGGDDWKLNVENAFLFVEGSQDDPVYTSADVNAFGLVYPRERRRQFQDKGLFMAERQFPNQWFARPVAAWSYIDMRTKMSQQTGYTNFVDRDDANGGFDVGRTVAQDVRLFSGYRYGYQYQQAIPWQGVSSTNDYQRALFGAEAKRGAWSLKGQLGPSFHNYTDERLPGQAKDICRLYADAATGYRIDPAQEVELTYLQTEALSSTSAASYRYYSLGAAYKNRLSETVSCTAQLRWVLADYEYPAVRCDGVFTPALSAEWKLSEHLAMQLSYEFNMGYNDKEGTPGRDFSRNNVFLSLSARY